MKPIYKLILALVITLVLWTIGLYTTPEGIEDGVPLVIAAIGSILIAFVIFFLLPDKE